MCPFSGLVFAWEGEAFDMGNPAKSQQVDGRTLRGQLTARTATAVRRDFERGKNMRNFVGFAVVLAVALAGGNLALAQPVDIGRLPYLDSSAAWDINDRGDVIGYAYDYGWWNSFINPNPRPSRPFFVATEGPNAFQMLDLGTLGGDTTDNWTMSMEVNNSGLVVGHAPTAAGPVHAFAWSKELGQKVDLGTLGGFSAALGVSDTGLIVGVSFGEWGADWVPVVWTRNPGGRSWTIHKLDTTGADQVCCWWVWAANNNGQLVGEGWDDEKKREVALVWLPDTQGRTWKLKRLPVDPAYPNAWAYDINDSGEIVGTMAAADWSIGRALIWHKGPGLDWTLAVLPALADNPAGWTEADGINNAGDVVGASDPGDGSSAGTFWLSTDLNHPKPAGFVASWSVLRRVNNDGVATGWYYDGLVDQAAIVRIR